MLRMLDRKSIDPAHRAAGRKKPPAVTGGTRVPHPMKLGCLLLSFRPPFLHCLAYPFTSCCRQVPFPAIPRAGCCWPAGSALAALKGCNGPI